MKYYGQKLHKYVNSFRRSEYHRRKNLDLICSAIKRVSDLNVAVNKRDDIVIDDVHKVNFPHISLSRLTSILAEKFLKLQWLKMIIKFWESFK